MLKILLAIGVVVLIAVVVTRYQGGEYKKFLATAKTTQATVIMRMEHETRQKNRRIEKLLGYQFTIDGKQYSGEDTVEFDDLWARVHMGDEIAVYYDPANPAKNYAVALVDRRLGVTQKLYGMWLK